MSNKKISPPPFHLPSIIVNENFCLLHKGEIEGEIYICHKCKTKYCMKCAEKAQEVARLCIKCKQLIFL